MPVILLSQPESLAFSNELIQQDDQQLFVFLICDYQRHLRAKRILSIISRRYSQISADKECL